MINCDISGCKNLPIETKEIYWCGIPFSVSVCSEHLEKINQVLEDKVK